MSEAVVLGTRAEIASACCVLSFVVSALSLAMSVMFVTVATQWFVGGGLIALVLAATGFIGLLPTWRRPWAGVLCVLTGLTLLGWCVILPLVWILRGTFSNMG